MKVRIIFWITLISCTGEGEDFVVYVSVVRDGVRIYSGVDERRVRDLYGGWSGFLTRGLFDGCKGSESLWPSELLIIMCLASFTYDVRA